MFFFYLVGPKQLASPNVFKEFVGGRILIHFGNLKFIKQLKTKVNPIKSKIFLKKCRYFLTNFDGRGILVFLDNQFFESFRFPKNHKPLKIPTPTAAPDHLLGGHNELGGTSAE